MNSISLCDQVESRHYACRLISININKLQILDDIAIHAFQARTTQRQTLLE